MKKLLIISLIWIITILAAYWVGTGNIKISFNQPYENKGYTKAEISAANKLLSVYGN